MSSIDGRSTFELMTAGWTRQVTELNTNGTVAVSIPKEAAEEHGIIAGDDVVITEASDAADETLRLHFNDNNDDE